MAEDANENPKIGLSAEARKAVTDVLNRILADEFTLYVQARAFHWNVTGRHFKQDHALFEEEYEAQDEIIDDVAERIRALGFKVQATMAQFIDQAAMSESDSTDISSEEMISLLLDRHEALASQLRSDIELADDASDEATADFLTGLLEGHEKRAWMLRAMMER